MAVTKASYGRYFSLSGTAAEVLQALNDEGVSPHQIVEMAEDATFAVYSRGV